MEKVKKQVKETYKTGKTIITNAEEFVIAVALLVSTFYNYYDLTIRPVGNVEYAVRLSAVVITSFVGFYLLVKHFNKRTK